MSNRIAFGGPRAALREARPIGRNDPLLVLCLSALCFLLSALSSPAQVVTHDVGIANYIAASTTITPATWFTNTVGTNAYGGLALTNPVAYVGQAQNWGAIFAARPFASNDIPQAITVTCARSLDNSTWETTPQFTFLLSVDGTNAVAAYTNLSTFIGPAPWLKIMSVANGATNILTNLTFKIAGKRNQ